MLEIDVTMEESFDEESNTFVTVTSFKVRLEHSLVSMSKWESLWKKPFLGKDKKTQKEIVSYIKFMILNDELPAGVFSRLIDAYVQSIQEYIADEMTATKLYNDPNAPTSREIITSELIYYWMVSLNIPVEFQDWHLNRLITLIRVINLKNTPKKKMTLNQRRELNRSRLNKYNTRG